MTVDFHTLSLLAKADSGVLVSRLTVGIKSGSITQPQAGSSSRRLGRSEFAVLGEPEHRQAVQIGMQI